MTPTKGLIAISLLGCVFCGCRNEAERDALNAAAAALDAQNKAADAAKPQSQPASQAAQGLQSSRSFIVALPGRPGTIAWTHEPGQSVARICFKGIGTSALTISHAELWLATPSGPISLPLKQDDRFGPDCFKVQSDQLLEPLDRAVLRFEWGAERFRIVLPALSPPKGAAALPRKPATAGPRTGRPEASR